MEPPHKPSGRRGILTAILAIIVLAGTLLWQRPGSPAPSTPATTPTNSSPAPSSITPRSGVEASSTKQSTTREASSAGIPLCATADLPQQADVVIRKIHHQGPFDYPANDGVRFGNYEKRLPQASRDYYREYTVATPGAHNRGARRIITGGPSANPEVWYYTADHYDTFCEIPHEQTDTDH